METQHLTYFKIENFKRFDSFEMSNLGQFNLMVGDNNVGKTSVLEALLFDEDLDQLMVNFLGSVVFRKMIDSDDRFELDVKLLRNTNFWSFIFNDIHKPIKCIQTRLGRDIDLSLSIAEFKDLETDTQNRIRQSTSANSPSDWVLLINQATGKESTKGAYFETSRPDLLNQLNVPLLSVNFGYNSDLVSNFFEHINGDRSTLKTIENQLKSFIPNLDELRVHRLNGIDILGVFLTNNNEIFPITRYGDGTVKFVRFLIEVVLAKGKRLMVDEIGSGIHFTRLVDYWKTIIRLCDQYKVQLFATTHSLECQQAFVEALEAPDMVQYQKDARNISLVENKQGEVKAVTYDFAQFEYALTIGFNTRGGKR